MTPTRVLYQDAHFLAVDKPSGLFVHRTGLSPERDTLARRIYRQLGHRVFTVHRLDRATSGAMLFALSHEAASEMGRLFRERAVHKTYLAVVRGFTEEAGTVDRPLRQDKTKEHRPSLTTYRRMATSELAIPVGPYATARYSLLEVKPETGRRHQIRKHCAHLSHPIVGDTTYGDVQHNRMFRDRFEIDRLLLAATQLTFLHPFTGENLHIQAPPCQDLLRVFGILGWTETGGDREPDSDPLLN